MAITKENAKDLQEAIESLGKVMYRIDVKDMDYQLLRGILITLRGLLVGYERLSK